MGKFTSCTGPVSFSWDISDESLSQYSLAIFVAGDAANQWGPLPPQDRETAVIDHLAHLVGKELAGKARDVLEVNSVYWTAEEYIWGAPTSSMGPGLLRKYGSALRLAFGNVHFGGGELAYEWKGYMEGAITAGQTAAEEVIAAIKSEGT